MQYIDRLCEAYKKGTDVAMLAVKAHRQLVEEMNEDGSRRSHEKSEKLGEKLTEMRRKTESYGVFERLAYRMGEKSAYKSTDWSFLRRRM